MELELINSLSESKIFRSKTYLDRFSPEQTANLFYLYVLAVYGLALNDQSATEANKYISKTLAFGNFDHFRNAGTDMYMLAHILSQEKYFNVLQFKIFMGNLRRSTGNADLYLYLNNVERQLKVKNPIYRNIKRVFANWDTEKESSRQQAVKRLYREIYYISPVAEILQPMSKLRDEK